MSSEVTELLRGWNEGRADARDELMRLVYEPLRGIAERHIGREREGHTLQPTALVHELYMRFADQRQVAWRDRVHFYAVAAHVMRRILVDHARRKRSEKRGSGDVPLAIEFAVSVCDEQDLDIVALDLALERLAAIFPQQSRIVELRFYGGMTLDETAEALGISAATVSREWAMARAWLRGALGSQ
jgi:RNA polymerase sigma factor (TIGR02999 family)